MRLALSGTGGERPGDAGAAGTPPAGAGIQTPLYYQGGQNANGRSPFGEIAGDTLGIDWLNVTGPADRLGTVAGCLDELDGGGYERRQGRNRYRGGLWWRTGADLSYDGPGGRWRLNVPGGVCRAYGTERLVRLMSCSMIGGRCTRLDICRDLRGVGVRVVESAIRSAEAGELRRLRSFRVFEHRSASNELEGLGVKFGGDGSVILHRVYDKGLETRTAGAGAWQRWEVQLRDELATERAVQIVTSAPDRLADVMMEAIAGTIDFRVGPRGEHLDELPRAGWWSWFAGAERLHLRAEAPSVDLQRWCEQFRKAYGGVLVYSARRAGVSVCELLEGLLEGVPITEGTRKNPVVDRLAAFVLRSKSDWRSHGGEEESCEEAAAREG